MEPDRYLTIPADATHELKVKGSRFVATATPVLSLEAALAKWHEIKKREYSANHHCYACCIGRFQTAAFKYSDDGEPSGSAGRPIYDQVVGRSLTNTLVVVTRYFGGTKLGAGGLARAYGESAGAVLDMVGTVERFLAEIWRVRVPLGAYDAMLRLTREERVLQTRAEFTDEATLYCTIRKSMVGRFVATTTELTYGKAEIEKVGETDA